MTGLNLTTGNQVRKAAREGVYTGPTAGLAPGYIQANMIILPSRYAADFKSLCQRNPVPCPLIAESSNPGSWNSLRSLIPTLPNVISSDVDLRQDVAKYMIYENGKVRKSGCFDLLDSWSDDHTAFLIGCSFSFETSLGAAGLAPPHVTYGSNVPMYRTSVPLNPAGVFEGGTYVVSMRTYKLAELEAVRKITSTYYLTHGGPIAWGWDAIRKLGIRDISSPEWGDKPLSPNGQPLEEFYESTDVIPIFWGCGVTPQEAVMRANLPGVVMGHMPGHMLVLDCQDDDIL